MECPCAKCRHLVTQQWVNKLHDSESDELEKFIAVDDRMLMCPPKILGYSLHLKVWCQFMVDKVEKIERNVMRKQEDFFETKLELNEDNKKLLKVVEIAEYCISRLMRTSGVYKQPPKRQRESTSH